MACVGNTTLCVAYRPVEKSMWRCPKIWKQGKTYNIQRTVRSFIYNTLDPFRAQCMVNHMNKKYDKILAIAEKVKMDRITREIEDFKQQQLAKKIKQAEQQAKERVDQMIEFFKQEKEKNEALVSSHKEPEPEKASTYIKNAVNSISSFPYLQSKLDKWHLDRKYAPIKIPHVELYQPISALPDATSFYFDSQYYVDNKDKDELPYQITKIAQDYELYKEKDSKKELAFSVNYGKQVSAFLVTPIAPLILSERTKEILRQRREKLDCQLGTIVYAGVKYSAKSGEIHRVVPLVTNNYPNRYAGLKDKPNYNQLLPQSPSQCDGDTMRRIVRPQVTSTKASKPKIVPIVIYPDSDEDDQLLDESDEDEEYQKESERLMAEIQSREELETVGRPIRMDIVCDSPPEEIEEQSLSDDDDYDYGLDYHDMNY